MVHIFIGRKVAIVLGAIALALTGSVYAISVDLAKKCREMAVKAHPPMPAGSRSGYAAAERNFFRKCVAQNGNMDNAGEINGSAAPK